MKEMSPAEKTLKNFVSLERCSSYKTIVPFILYLPIGLILGLIRCFIFLHVCLVFLLLPDTFPFKRWILRVMVTVIGLPVTSQGDLRLDNKHVVIANHISNLDPFILTLLHSYVLAVESPNMMSTKNVPSKQIKLPADVDHAELINVVNEKMKENEEPLLFFPEKVKTNGTGVLKFSSLPFEGDHPIQPVIIQAKRFLFNMNVSTINSSLMEDFLWCLVLPFTLFNVKYLPLTEKKKDESVEDFTRRAQANMAKSVNLQPLAFTYTDISLYLKEQEKLKVCNDKERKDGQGKGTKFDSPKPESLYSPEFEKMLLQVRDVLPDTPVASIVSDLKRTQDVDTTITNILEGKVDTTASNTSETDSLFLKSGSQSLEGQLFKASKFEQNAKARQLSFAERKQAMLEAARLKYRIKHGL